MERFQYISEELRNLIHKEYDKEKLNTLIDELNAMPFKMELFVHKYDAETLINALCSNVKPIDEFLAAKTSHLIYSIVTKQNLRFSAEFICKVISWHVECLKKCSEIVLPDILHSIQCILQFNAAAGSKVTADLIGNEGILIKLLDPNKSLETSQSSVQIHLLAMKCIVYLLSSTEENKTESNVTSEMKDYISQIVVKFLMKGYSKSQDDFLYCKVVISALRVLSQVYFGDPSISIPLPEVMGISRYFVLYGLVTQGNKLEKIMPAQQTIAMPPVVPNPNPKGGKKQKLRKQRNNAIESLKKEIPVSDRSLMKDVDNFENNSAYKPASKNYLEPRKENYALTSDSDMSDVENNREVKLIALKSRVRQSASNLLLVLVKVKEKREIFGYWWALLPDCPDASNWSGGESAKKTLAYCAVTDPIASSRACVLSAILALLSGSRMYLYQAETSKKESTSFIPFSESLGYMIVCMHKVLQSILESERSHAVILMALKCCAALVQATPYHKMKEGLITDLVMATRKFLVHRDTTLQVGALITMGCVLSVDPKVDEVLKAIEKDAVPSKISTSMSSSKVPHSNNIVFEPGECDDFEEGYSDDEMFTAVENETESIEESDNTGHYFRSWILDICFKNMGWIFKGNDVTRIKPSAIPIVLESLQVVSAVAFHHLRDLLHPHITLLSDILSEMLQYEHQDVVLQSAKVISIIGDGIQKLEHLDQAPPLSQCVKMWANLITPLSSVLQCHENTPAKAMVCDCIANIGERSFKELPRHLQLLCCTLLIGSCSDEEAMVRAAAVRGLAMLVMYRTLREDIGFVSDCGENILRALAESTLLVRIKGAWALGNLSDALVLNMEDPNSEEIDDDLLIRLLEVSVQCALDNDKVKMSATRGLGNLLRLIKTEKLLRNTQIRALCESAIEKLLDCACKVNNMKVRWNACYAMGNVMKNEQLFTAFNGWQGQVFPSFCSLAQECKNLKVRITAATALRAPTARTHYGASFVPIWRGMLTAMENAANVDDYNEYKHKDNLIEQLCVTLAHLCCLLTPADLSEILDPLVFHYDCAKSLFTQVCHKLPPENASCLKILQAAKYVTVDLTATSDAQMQALSMLQDIFIWDM